MDWASILVKNESVISVALNHFLVDISAQSHMVLS